MNVITDQMAPTNVLIVGVGGQGVIMVSKVLARLCQLKGFQVKQSEVHGMAKRGGGVFSHVRFGQQVWSPTIPKGEADILVALEWAEGLRWLNHLKRHQGTFLSDTQQIVPPFSCRDRKRGAQLAYPKETPRDVIELVGNGFRPGRHRDRDGTRQRARGQHGSARRPLHRPRFRGGRLALGPRRIRAAQDQGAEPRGLSQGPGMGGESPGIAGPRRQHRPRPSIG